MEEGEGEGEEGEGGGGGRGRKETDPLCPTAIGLQAVPHWDGGRGDRNGTGLQHISAAGIRCGTQAH